MYFLKSTLLSAFLLLSLTSLGQFRFGVQDYPDLLSVQNETLVPRENDKIYVKSVRKLFAWEGTCTEATDYVNSIKQTNVAVGRWVLVGGNAYLANTQTWTGTNTFSTINATGTTVSGIMTANTFRIPGELSKHFLKADGSVDTTTYAPRYAFKTINGLSIFGSGM